MCVWLMWRMQEFVSTREDLPMQRKTYLRAQLVAHVPAILQQLAAQLRDLLARHPPAAPFAPDAHAHASLLLGMCMRMLSRDALC